MAEIMLDEVAWMLYVPLDRIFNEEKVIVPPDVVPVTVPDMVPDGTKASEIEYEPFEDSSVDLALSYTPTVIEKLVKLDVG